MQRIPFPDISTLPEIVQKMLAGTPLNIVRVGANASPSMFQAQGQLSYAIADPDVLHPRLRETVILRVAYLSISTYELRHHVALGRKMGLTESDLSAIARQDYTDLEPLLAAAARFTDEVVLGTTASDETLAALRAVASDQTVINIVLAIGVYMSMARLIAVTGIEPDEQAIDHLPKGLDDGLN